MKQPVPAAPPSIYFGYGSGGRKKKPRDGLRPSNKNPSPALILQREVYAMPEQPSERVVQTTNRPHGAAATALSPEARRIIIAAMRNGAHRGTAAKYARVRPERMAEWMTRTGEPYESFQADIMAAETHAELRCIVAAMSKVETDPRIAVMLLERRWPRRWGKRPAVTVEQHQHVSLANGAVALAQSISSNDLSIEVSRVHALLARVLPARKIVAADSAPPLDDAEDAEINSENGNDET